MRDQTIAKITSEQTLNTDEIDYVVNSIANEAKVSVSIEIKPTKFDKVKEVRTRTETTLYQVRRWRKDENDRLYITMWQDRGQAHESVMIDLVTGTVKTYRINNHHGAKYTPGTEAIMQALLPESSEQADTPTSHRITMTIHPDLYSVIKDYKDNHDCTIGFAAAQICAIGAEATEGRFVHAIVSPWGGSRDGAGRPAEKLLMTVEDAEGDSVFSTYGHVFTSVEDAEEYLRQNGGGIISIATATNVEADRNTPFAQTVNWEDEPREIVVESDDDNE